MIPVYKMNICTCGRCNKEVKPGRRFIHGHNAVENNAKKHELRKCLYPGCVNTFDCRKKEKKKYCKIHSRKYRIGKHYTDFMSIEQVEHCQKLQSLNSSGRKNKNKTYENLYGIDKALQIKTKQALSHIGKPKPKGFGNLVRNRQLGKSYEDIWGVDKAKRAREKLSLIRTQMIENGWGTVNYFFSKKNNCNLFYRSSYELLAFQILESSIMVKSYKINFPKIKYIFNNKEHRYIVDLFVEYTDGQKQMIEVKANWALKDPRTITKLEAGKRFAEQNGMKWDVWTEKDLGISKL